MTSNETDDRMHWVRNLDLLKESSESYIHEFEVASEKSITGLLDYEHGSIRAYQLASPNVEGLAKYMIDVKMAQLLFDPEKEAKKATEKGYVARSGVIGELLGILSVHFEARFFHLSSSIRFSPLGMQVRTYENFDYRRCRHDLDKDLFTNAGRTFASEDLKDFLNKVRKLPTEHHQAFGFAFEHYARAVREVGDDEEMFFVRMVSAVEAVSQGTDITEEDWLCGFEFDELFCAKEKLDVEQYNSLKETFKVRKTTAKFLKFLKLYGTDFLTDEEKPFRIPPTRLKKVTGAIYGARSDYLHTGTPMYLSLRLGKDWPDWDISPDRGMKVGGRRWKKDKHLPYPHWFRRLVRHCLLRYLDELV